LDLSKGWSDFMKETPDVHYFLVEFCQNSIVWSLADFFTSKTEKTIEREPCGGVSVLRNRIHEDGKIQYSKDLHQFKKRTMSMCVLQSNH
jgi:hypothetical protein